MRREKTVCFTGHRPEKLKSTKEEIVFKLEKAVDKAIEDGFDTFITGLAEGVDLWAGKMIIEKKQNGAPLKLIAAMPFRNFTAESSEFAEIIANADEIYIISKGDPDSEDDASYAERDRWMVDNSSLVISVYEGREGGTRNTIEHALNNGIEVVYLCDRL